MMNTIRRKLNERESFGLYEEHIKAIYIHGKKTNVMCLNVYARSNDVELQWIQSGDSTRYGTHLSYEDVEIEIDEAHDKYLASRPKWLKKWNLFLDKLIGGPDYNTYIF